MRDLAEAQEGGVNVGQKQRNLGLETKKDRGEGKETGLGQRLQGHAGKELGAQQGHCERAGQRRPTGGQGGIRA